MLTRHHPNVPNLKAQARRYRSSKVAQGREVSHSRALELVARQYGFFDWNTAIAHARTLPVPEEFPAGSHVSGRYMGQDFEARVTAATRLSAEETFISLELWEPVDVVQSDRFSAFRKRVSGVIGPDGNSYERLSTGNPQLAVRLQNRGVK